MWQLTINTTKLFDRYNHKLTAYVQLDSGMSSSSSSSQSSSSTADNSCTVPTTTHIFLYERSNAEDIFVGVCSVADLLEYPEDTPAYDNIYFRKSSIDLVLRSAQLLDYMVTKLTTDVSELKANINTVNALCTSSIPVSSSSSSSLSSSSSSSSVNSSSSQQSSSDSGDIMSSSSSVSSSSSSTSSSS